MTRNACRLTDSPACGRFDSFIPRPPSPRNHMPPKKKPRIGRPPSGRPHTPPRSLRVPDEVWERWQKKAAAAGKTLTAWIVERCERESA